MLGSLWKGTCVRKLKRQNIDVLVPEKIKTIADVSVVCFDKTGTLTGSVVCKPTSCGHCHYASMEGYCADGVHAYCA